MGVRQFRTYSAKNGIANQRDQINSVVTTKLLFFFVYECARCCKSWTQPLASLEKFVCHCKSPRMWHVNYRYEGQARGKPPKEEGKRGPQSRRGSQGDKRVSAKCKAMRASQVSVSMAVDEVPDDLCLAACKGIRLAVSRSCMQNLTKCVKVLVVRVFQQRLRNMSAHKHAVAWSAGHVCRRTYRIKSAAATDTEPRLEAEHNEQNATKAHTPPRRGRETRTG